MKLLLLNIIQTFLLIEETGLGSNFNTFDWLILFLSPIIVWDIGKIIFIPTFIYFTDTFCGGLRIESFLFTKEYDFLLFYFALLFLF